MLLLFKTQANFFLSAKTVMFEDHDNLSGEIHSKLSWKLISEDPSFEELPMAQWEKNAKLKV